MVYFAIVVMGLGALSRLGGGTWRITFLGTLAVLGFGGHLGDLFGRTRLGALAALGNGARRQNHQRRHHGNANDCIADIT